MCASSTTPTPDTYKSMDASVPILFDDTTILIPFPETTVTLSTLLKPLKTEVLMKKLHVLMLFKEYFHWKSVVLKGLDWYHHIFDCIRVFPVDLQQHHRHLGTNKTYCDQFGLLDGVCRPYSDKSRYTLTRLLSRDGRLVTLLQVIGMNGTESNLSNRSTAFRLVATFALLLPGFILSNAYISVYTGLLAVPKYDVQIRSVEDVASNPAIMPYINKGSGTHQYLEVVLSVYVDSHYLYNCKIFFVSLKFSPLRKES